MQAETACQYGLGMNAPGGEQGFLIQMFPLIFLPFAFYLNQFGFGLFNGEQLGLGLKLPLQQPGAGQITGRLCLGVIVPGPFHRQLYLGIVQ